MSSTTIKDIATRAHVSVATVSRVINGNRPVGEEARERVIRAVHELNYRPNAVARSLRQNRTGLVALIVVDIANTFFMDIAKGLVEELEKTGDHTLIASSDASPEKERLMIDKLMEHQVDGFVVVSTDHTPAKFVELMEQKVPLVVVDRMFDDIVMNQVGWDNYVGAKKLAQILIENGHKIIAIMNGSRVSVNGAKGLLVSVIA